MSEKFETAFSLSLNNDQSTEMYKAEDVKAFVVMYVATLALLSQPLNLPKKNSTSFSETVDANKLT